MQPFLDRQNPSDIPSSPRTLCVRLLPLLILSLSLFSSSAAADSPDTSTNAAQIAAVKARMDTLTRRIQQIVNQPVTELRRTPDMHDVGTYPYWFHPGAFKPDFQTVDIRKSQELPYSKFQYVTSYLNPGVVFLGSALEFNGMTKYFYTDRSVPKKKLTEAEMLEINQLYRAMAECEHELLDLEHPIDKESLKASKDADQPAPPQSLATKAHRWIFTHKPAAALGVAALLVILIVLRKLRAPAAN